MKYATLLLMLATLPLAACGRSESPAPQAGTPTGGSPAVPLPLPAQPVASAAPDSGTASVAVNSDHARGQQIYRQTCAFCHDKGLAGAPKSGDAGAWSPRLAQGIDTLYASALQGKNAMPAKGGNPSLADGDVRAAVDYLAAQVH
jgi:cytochrome c5